MKRNLSAPSRSYAWLLILLVVAALLLVVIFTCRQQRTVTSNEAPRPNGTPPAALQLPAIRSGDQVIRHTGYTLLFEPAHEQAGWVAYVLRGYQVAQAKERRTNNFLPDPAAKPHSADDQDYEGSGYDRGHLASAEDMAWSAQTMRESFYYTNMSPQVPAFNRGVWKRLEELVRYWAQAYDSVYVVTGPVLTSGLPSIGPDHVSVPQLFYKAVLVYGPSGAQAVGFVLPNEASSGTLKSFAVPIDSVEHLTGFDLYPQLPDNVEEKLESGYTEKSWLWTRKKAK